MAEKDGGAGDGLFVSLKALSANLLGIVQTRLELLSTDISEERERIVTLVVFGLMVFKPA